MERSYDDHREPAGIRADDRDRSDCSLGGKGIHAVHDLSNAGQPREAGNDPQYPESRQVERPQDTTLDAGRAEVRGFCDNCGAELTRKSQARYCSIECAVEGALGSTRETSMRPYEFAEACELHVADLRGEHPERERSGI